MFSGKEQIISYLRAVRGKYPCDAVVLGLIRRYFYL
jgi:hypothetical protein